MPSTIEISAEIFSANDTIAQQNRRIFDKNKIFTINLIASPGAGKTSIIEVTLNVLSRKFAIAVINGDLATDLDAERAKAAGAEAVNVNTGGECHLDAVMISNALSEINLNALDIIIIENVGNLVCPASFKLGAHKRVVIASVPEGDDKPYKYPGTFNNADVIILNKVDLLPYVPFDLEKFKRGVRLLNPQIELFELSCINGNGVEDWCAWLSNQICTMKST